MLRLHQQSTERRHLAARNNGRLGGLSRSEKKVQAVRVNLEKTRGISSEARRENAIYAQTFRRYPTPKPKPKRNPRTGRVKYDFWY